MSDIPTESWTTVAARGAKTKVLRSAPTPEVQSPLIGEDVFEHEDLNKQILARKASAILQQALTPGTVLFSFPKKLFKVYTDAYVAIKNQIGKISGCIPISHYNSKQIAESLVEIKFQDPSHVDLAISKGVTIGDMVFNGVSSKDDMASRPLTHVRMTMLHLPDEDEFIMGLKQSMRPYGRIHQIKKYYRNGFYESKVSVLLDTASGYLDDDGEFQKPAPLTRNILLDKWNIIVPVWHKGADPLCGFCRFSGHKITKRPELKKQKCFKCNNRGHTRNFCPKKDSSTAMDIHDTTVMIKNKMVIEVEDDDCDKEVPRAPSKPIRIASEDVDKADDAEELPLAAKYFNENPNGTLSKSNCILVSRCLIRVF
ncbi:hypothetical protein HPULCUR_000129 [Helicostylum pulchrum]|uniref:CCHC-type domain-containing protein n=1 Tax=Helicostylum pulchrum TaxID=562976 RepID=A0ABP9XL41_9FUNG